MDRSGRRSIGDGIMFNLAQDWITYIFIAFFIGFWTYIIIKGRKASENELQNGVIGKEEKALKKD